MQKIRNFDPFSLGFLELNLNTGEVLLHSVSIISNMEVITSLSATQNRSNGSSIWSASSEWISLNIPTKESTAYVVILCITQQTVWHCTLRENSHLLYTPATLQRYFCMYFTLSFTVDCLHANPTSVMFLKAFLTSKDDMNNSLNICHLQSLKIIKSTNKT